MIVAQMQCPPQQQREHGVFGQMTAFPENMMNILDMHL